MKLDCRGHETFYELRGDAGAPVVVLSHALGACSAMWQAQIKVLEKDYQVLCYDVRGHGQSGTPAGSYSLDELADDAETLLEALAVDQVYWVGACLGGMIGQTLALRPSQRLLSLVLASTQGGLTRESRHFWSENDRLARKRGLEALVANTLGGWFTEDYRQREPDQMARFRDQILAGSVTGFSGCCQAMLGLGNLARLGDIDLPTLVVVGAQDRIAPIADALAIHERIAGSRLEVLQAAAHLAVVEQAARFNATLLEFLR